MAGVLNILEGEDSGQPVTLGVLSDTHVPDRIRSLDPEVLALFRQAGVKAILHAGDISAPQVLDELRQVAPVYAVRGNRDWLWLGELPIELNLSIRGVNVTLVHGHGNWWQYLIDRVRVILFGYRLELFLPRLLADHPQPQVLVFGHVHRPFNQQINQQLVFNPGTPHIQEEAGVDRCVGLLIIYPDGRVEGRHLPLSTR